MLGRMFDWEKEGSEPPRVGRRRGHRGLKILVVLLLLALAAGVSGFTYYRWCQGASGDKHLVTITIPHGASGSDIVSTLHDRGVIRCGLVSRLVLRTRDQSFEAGTYTLTTNMTLDDALDALDR